MSLLAALATWRFEALVAAPTAVLALGYLAAARRCGRPRRAPGSGGAGRHAGRYLLLLAAMPADIATGAVFMLHGPIGPYGGADVRAAGVIMLAGGDLIMTGLAVWLAAALAKRTRHGERRPDLAAYNAYLASLEAPEG